MKRLSIQFFAIVCMWLCASVTAFAAVDWDQYQFLGDGAGSGKYANKYKVESVNNIPTVVNIQQVGWAAETGIYMTFPSAPITSCTIAGKAEGEGYKADGAGVILYLSAFTAQETEVTVVYNGNTSVFHVYYVDGAVAKKYNVVLNETATASSGTASAGNDGDEGTRWESAFADDQWWMCEMAEQSQFNTVQILWETAYAKSFRLEVSNDGTTWSTIQTITDQTLTSFPYLQTLSVGEQNAKYLRFYGVARGTGYGFSFYELRAFEKKAQTLTTIELKAAAEIVKLGETLKITTATKDQDGEAMDATVTYTISPADAGTLTDGVFTPAKSGAVTITATSGEVSSQPVSFFCYDGTNLALSTNISTDNKVIAQSAMTPSGTDAFYAVDGNDGSIWQGSATNGTATDEDSRTYDSWFTLDLGAYYSLSLVTIHFEGACSQAYHLDCSIDNTSWNEAYNYVGKAEVNGHTDLLYGDNLKNASVVRYVRFYSTKAATQYGMKIFEMQVFGTPTAAPADNEKPVMVTATLVSNTYNSAVISVSATDNVGVAKYRVVDATNNIDATYTATEGNITVTGLTPSTSYNFTITAIDLVGNESDNSLPVSLTTPEHKTAPEANPAAPTYPANQVKAIYSATYNADCNFAEWGSNTTYAQDTYGKKFVTTEKGYFGLEGFALNCSSMEALHLDVWCEEDMTLEIFPIWGGDEMGITKSVKGEQWNGIDISLSEFTKITNWTNISQLKIANAPSKTFWLNNIYFYTTQAPAQDVEAPTDFTVSIAAVSYLSVDIKAKATDNSGSVIFQVFNNDKMLTSKTAVSATETTFTVSNLAAGTAYNLTVKAVDEAGNSATNAEPTSFTTKTLPAPAPVPTATAAEVQSIYSDTYTPAVTRTVGNWNQKTVETEVTLAEGDQALLYTTCNWLGWENVTIDATNTPNLHIDIYVEEAGTIGFTPIWKKANGENAEAVKTYNLVAGWNSLAINLTADFAGIDLATIYQIKWADMPTTCFIDNVYFYKDGSKTAIEDIQGVGSDIQGVGSGVVRKIIENGQVVIVRDGVRYNAFGQVIR